MANSAFTPAVLTVSGSSSTSSGEKNYVTATDGNASGLWVASGVTVATSTSTIPDNITKASSLAITWTSGTTGYARYRFTLDQADYGKKFKIQWDQVYGTAGHWTLQVYSNTASDYTGTSTALTVQTSAVPGITGTFTTSVDMSGSTAPYIEIRIVASSTSATTIYLNSILMGPGTIVQGAAISEWQSYTPTFSAGVGTASTINFWYRRVGTDLEIQGSFLTGTVAGSVATFTLPNNLTVGNTAVAVRSSFGIWHAQPASAGLAFTYGGVIVATALGANTIGFDYQVAASTSIFSARNGSTIFNSSSIVTIHAMIPCAEFSGSGTVSLGAGAQVEYAYNSDVTSTASVTSSGFSYGQGGVVFSSAWTGFGTDFVRRVQFQYPIQSDDLIVVEVNRPGFAANTWETVDALAPNVTIGSNFYGVSIAPVNGSSTQIDVIFQRGGAYPSGASWAANGQAWSGLNPNWYWRVRKSKASSPVGFGLVNANDSGLTRAYSTLTKIRLNTGNGFGSTNTTIRRFSTTVVNIGTGITYADSSTLGATFTVTEAGIYSISYSDGFNAAAAFGISLNSTQLTTSIATITAADRLCLSVTSAADYHQTVGVTLTLSVGDVIRAHASAAESANPARSQFTIQRIA